MQESDSSKVLRLWGSHHNVRSAQAFHEVFQITTLTPQKTTQIQWNCRVIVPLFTASLHTRLFHLTYLCSAITTFLIYDYRFIIGLFIYSFIHSFNYSFIYSFCSLSSERSIDSYRTSNVFFVIFLSLLPFPRGEFRPRQTRQLPRAVDLKGRLRSCQSY